MFLFVLYGKTVNMKLEIETGSWMTDFSARSFWNSSFFGEERRPEKVYHSSFKHNFPTIT